MDIAFIEIYKIFFWLQIAVLKMLGFVPHPNLRTARVVMGKQNGGNPSQINICNNYKSMHKVNRLSWQNILKNIGSAQSLSHIGLQRLKKIGYIEGAVVIS